MKPYPFHRAALAPLLPNASKDTLERSIQTVIQQNEDAFSRFLLNQGLAPLWAEQLEQYGKPTPLSDTFRKNLKNARLQATGEYMLQRNRLEQTRDILDGAGIQHAVFKGASNRERFFTNPALRPSVDQDVLVAKEDKVEAEELHALIES